MEETKEMRVTVEREEENTWFEPVSPTGQYFNSSALSVSVLAVFESEIAIDDSPATATLEKLFLPVTPRFSSIIVRDKKGVQQWKRVKVNLPDHIHVPVFPPGLDSYDNYVQDYLSDIAMRQLPQHQPLWEIHIIKYPTKKSMGSIVFKLHHALGDGFSLMAALFACLQRADDPSLPLTFPSSKVKVGKERSSRARRVASICANTIRDFGWGIWKSNLADDDVSPVRSGVAGLEFRPIIISDVEFSLDDIRRIKSKLGGTINDIISGVIFYGTQLYIQAAAGQGTAQVTSLVLLNTRVIRDYQRVQDMTKSNAKSPWGNQFGFLHVSIPKCKDAEKTNPLDFVIKARKIIKAKRSSLSVYLTGRLLELMRQIKGPEATAKYIHATLKKTSMTISNLTGPMEKMAMANHPVKSFHFMVVGVPQSLTISVVSYMGKLKVAVGAEKGYINSQLFTSYMEKSFQRIYEATLGK
ncbi:wax ester synthase/diacylglycerol acyltransferase 4-like [Typha angustifolia]|uniref:wax ester synthase/diacylglycerol acyltransferase 4-like n=1 Tax=Typha angustifolia TaxID=59011 RepID=UPI003C2FF337